ncbi:MAG: GTPase [Deltaproteobacteria bacterium]|nr:GTPase [Deltaproteobacteria bacterium]
MQEKVIIMGAAGRDFHNFNVYFRNNERYQVVGFTATQIPNIEGRLYPPELSGKLYPNGISIYPDSELKKLITDNKVDLVAFSYSDIPHAEVMHKASIANAAGADFILIAAPYTMLQSSKKVISVCAVRTGCGKSQTSRQVLRILKGMGKKVVTIRHPMPYGDLAKQAVQRFAKYEDFEKHDCTIEEREEYEPVVDMGAVIYAGVDYERILREAEKEADVIIWDGGNNDTSFIKPDIHIVVFDPHRAGHELAYHPGETNMMMADIAVINKIDSAEHANVEIVRNNIRRNNPDCTILLADSEILADDPHVIRGKKVLVVEDGPTLTHGDMKYGAGIIAAKKFHAGSIVDPRPWLVKSIKATFDKYPHIGTLLPAMGYGKDQINDMEATINKCDCDLVLFATPIDLTKLLKINKPTVRIRYEYKDHDPGATLESEIKRRGLFS